VRRALPALGTAAIGALLAVATLVGGAAATGPSPDPQPEPAQLALGTYCRHLFGARAAAYQPEDLSGWRCSVWRNGVWGLEEVDLAAACRWQAGPDAVLESVSADSASGAAGGGGGSASGPQSVAAAPDPQREQEPSESGPERAPSRLVCVP
jgi:hypothetical protein